MSVSGEALGALVAIVVLVLLMPLGLLAAYRYYQGEDPAERAAAREREKAVLREAAGAPNFNYLLALVWARWCGITRRDRRVVQAVWLGWSVLLLFMVGISGSGWDAKSLLAALVLLPFTYACLTIAIIFRMR